MKIEFTGKLFSLTVSADIYCLIASVYTILGVFESLYAAIMCQDTWGEQP